MVARAETFARGCGASLEATEKWMAIYFLVGPLITNQGVSPVSMRVSARSWLETSTQTVTYITPTNANANHYHLGM